MSPADPGDARWRAVLDELEAHLARQRAAVRAGDWPSITAFPVPRDLGPVPAGLAPRLDAARRASQQLEASVAHRRDELGRRLAALPRRRPTGPRKTASCYLDTTA
jgi:hypothetical protein